MATQLSSNPHRVDGSDSSCDAKQNMAACKGGPLWLNISVSHRHGCATLPTNMIASATICTDVSAPEP
jgi:hypothetical protein